MSEDKQVNQPQNDVPEVEVKETQTDNKPQPQPQFTQQDVDRIIKQRLESEKAKNQRALDEIKAKEQEALKQKEIQEAKSKSELEKLMQARIAEKDTEILRYKT